MASCSGLPHFAKGLITKGFGRGSKELGIPTANFPEDVVKNLPDSLNPGVYYGYASVNKGPVYKMVMSIGWNPFYNNTLKSMETHILHKFEGDLYGCELRVIILGYIRPEKNFNSVDALIDEINNDISLAEIELNEDKYAKYKNFSIFDN